MSDIHSDRQIDPKMTMHAGVGKVTTIINNSSSSTSSTSASIAKLSMSSTSSSSDTDSTAVRSKRSVRQEHIKRARATDGSRRHDETISLIREGFNSASVDSKDQTEKMMKAMSDFTDKLTQPSSTQEQIKQLTEQQQKLETDMTRIQETLTTLVGLIKPLVKKRKIDDEDE